MAVNWYKFRIELFGVVWKTINWVLAVLVYLRMDQYFRLGTFPMVPVELGFIVEHRWIWPLAMVSFIGILWLCYYRAFAIFRRDKRYGER